VFYWNMNGKVTDANNKFLDIVGYNREELASGRINLITMTPPEYRYLDEAPVIELKATGVNKQPFEKVFIHKNCTHIPVILAGATLDEARTHGVAFVLDNTERKRAEAQIKASLAEKDVMLREIHHRVKNNLQIISSLVSLQADNLIDERMREEFKDVRDRVRSMVLVHEKLYQTSDLAQLSFGDYATSLLHSLWRSHGALADKVRLHLAVAPVALPIEAAVPCGLLLNELAGNALKHAFPGNSGGEVTITLEHDAATGTVSLQVRDNGVGLPAGMDWRQSRSLGLRLVQILTSQLRGTLETGNGPGTTFQVKFFVNSSPAQSVGAVSDGKLQHGNNPRNELHGLLKPTIH
jgi:PAS domain S-box-containing protein